MRPTVKVTMRDNSASLKAALKKLQRTDVLVGWPEASNSRQSGEIGNAALAYIHSHGSALQNIPARPILQPAIEASPNKELIQRELKAAAEAVLDQDPARATMELNRAGQVAANAVKSWFTTPENQWAPNSPETIAKKGSDRPLIDTGQLRRSVSFVVKEN